MRYNKLSDKEKQKLIKEYYDEKITATQLAKNYNISRRTLYLIINRHKEKKGGNIKEDKEFKIFKIDNSNEIKKDNSEEDLSKLLRLAYLSTRK